MATNQTRTRDYTKEYQARIARGLAVGKSRSQARGHAKAGDTRSEVRAPFDKDDPLERALKLIKKGATQKQAAKEVRVSAERVRRYQKQNTISRREGRRWIIVDDRPVTLVMASRGKLRDVTVTHDAASDIGRHWVAVNRFLEANDASHLKPFVGFGLRDTVGKLWPFETRPNVLRKLDSVGDLSFVDIYRQTAQQ
ncbi:MAG: hypothetical protein JWM36_2619 [Hyphomicrobiales bacterium]|nr:hypothetical protein [Hyphomicrobiales bacterium]